MYHELVNMAAKNNNTTFLCDPVVYALSLYDIDCTATPYDDLNAIRVVIPESDSGEVTASLVSNALEELGLYLDNFEVRAVRGKEDTVIVGATISEAFPSLEKAGVVEASPDEEDDPVFDEDDTDGDEGDDPTVSEDEDGSEEPVEDDLKSEEDEDRLVVLNTPETTKMVARLYSVSCGSDMGYYPSFWRNLDNFCQAYRYKSGYQEVEESSVQLEIAKGKKFKEGRGGFLSSFMRASSGATNDKLVAAWDSMDHEKLKAIMDDITKTVVSELKEYAEKKDKK